MCVRERERERQRASCVCVRDRERESEREREKERERGACVLCERERKRDLCETEIKRYSVPVVRPWCWDGLRSCWPCSSVRVLWARLRLRYQSFETIFMTWPIVYD